MEEREVVEGSLVVPDSGRGNATPDIGRDVDGKESRGEVGGINGGTFVLESELLGVLSPRRVVSSSGRAK